MQGRGAGRQSGIAVVAIVAVLAVLAAGAGFLAWQKMGEVDRLQTDLNNTKLGFDKARVDLRKAAQDSAAITKEVTELRVAVDQVRAERDSVRNFMETEQAAGVRLRGEMALLKEQVSYLSVRSSPAVVKGMPRAPQTPQAPPAAKK